MIPHTPQNCNTYHRFLTPDDFSAIADRFHESLPNKPYCTNNLGYVKVRPKAIAIRQRYIQHNPPCHTQFLIFDVDRQGAVLAWYDKNLPPPTFTTQNLENGHAHLAYALSTPVCTTDNARQKPLDYLAKIQAGLTRKLRADFGYSNFITKNPLYPHWRTHVWRIEPYELAELADYVDLLPLTDKEREVGLGRNCTLFDNTRIWAYEAVRDYRHLSTKRSHFWEEAVLNHVLGQNMLLAEPLPYSEIRAIAKSVARFCLRNDTRCYAKFIERQREKGQKGAIKANEQSQACNRGGMARSASYEQKRQQALALFVQGRTVVQIAKELGCHRNSIKNWLSNL